MKILYITPQLPLPAISGGRIKLLSTLKALISLNHEVVLFSLFENKDDLKYVNEIKKIGIKKIFTYYNHEIRKRDVEKKLLRLIKSFFTYKPYSLLRYFNKQMDLEIKKYLKENDLDIAWSASTYMTQYLQKDFEGIKVFEALDVDSVTYQEAFFKSHQKSVKFLYFWEWIKYTIYEKLIYKKFDLIFAVCKQDKKLFEKIFNRKNIFVLPPSIGVKTTTREKRGANTLLFAGTLFWYPNKDGLNWFFKKVLPQIQKAIPSMKLWIIGPYKTNFKPIKLKGVKYFGPKSPQEVEHFMNKASVFICPILYGTAIRVKILVAMSCSIPVVSTNEGAKGLDVTDGKELLLAENEKEFAKKTILLLRNKQLQQKLIKNGKKFIEDHYSPKILCDAITERLSTNFTSEESRSLP